MECCPFLDRLIDLEAGTPLDPELEFHLLICEECRKDWETVQLIREVFPDRESWERACREFEEEKQWIEEMIPGILAALSSLSWSRERAPGWSFLEWGPWRGMKRPG